MSGKTRDLNFNRRGFSVWVSRDYLRYIGHMPISKKSVWQPIFNVNLILLRILLHFRQTNNAPPIKLHLCQN
jgi:hypothetical protein